MTLVWLETDRLQLCLRQPYRTARCSETTTRKGVRPGIFIGCLQCRGENLCWGDVNLTHRCDIGCNGLDEAFRRGSTAYVSNVSWVHLLLLYAHAWCWNRFNPQACYNKPSDRKKIRAASSTSAAAVAQQGKWDMKETELAPPCCRETSVMEQLFIGWRPLAQCTMPFWAQSLLNATALFGNLLPHMLARKVQQHECASVSGTCEMQYSFPLCVCSGNTQVCSNNLHRLSI